MQIVVNHDSCAGLPSAERCLNHTIAYSPPNKPTYAIQWLGLDYCMHIEATVPLLKWNNTYKIYKIIYTCGKGANTEIHGENW